jgi:hypothetical protein
MEGAKSEPPPRKGLFPVNGGHLERDQIRSSIFILTKLGRKFSQTVAFLLQQCRATYATESRVGWGTWATRAAGDGGI